VIALNFEMVVSSIIGFTPAILLLYILLRRYADFLEDKNIFMAFAAGMVLGMIIAVFHLASDEFLLSALDLAFLFFVFMFALFEESAKLVILNMPRLALKSDTLYYGAALGLGIGSMSVIAISFRIFLADPDSFGNAISIAGFVVLSFNFCLIHAATGVMIGYGCARGMVFNQFTRALMAHSVYNVFLLFYLWMVGTAKFAFLFAASIVAIFLFYYALKELMPWALPPELQKRRRRDMRKRAREKRKG
jgi:hypothetical protein